MKPAVSVVTGSVNLSDAKLRDRTSDVLQRREVAEFRAHYEEAFDPEESKPVDLGEPYLLEARNATTGIVLAHGYLASPKQVRLLAEHLRSHGITVYAMRLAGHGTAPEQLTEVHWKDWVEGMLRGHALVRQHCEHVILGGFSLGGVLALLAAERQPEATRGVVSINAPFLLRDRRALFVGTLLRWHGLKRLLGLADGHYKIANESESPDINYGTDYLRGIRELKRAVRACRRRLDSITVPALIVQADHDPVVDPESGRYLLRHLSSRDKVLTTLPFERHQIIRGDDCRKVFDTVSRFAARLVEPAPQVAA